ncbi:substrate-binding domain-containing protein [Diplocloster agilis]|uniref:substrate-binding domain-containing protein n=1 Tax=Diplocloster agilis TaxID=2850323 RepID=UPI00082314D0|nr:substrate-binding domain-containing protein [Suonthocola fibrivorans]MCU6732336.1 substrate-binding domain-containing protein [Suonthocola fibrivorans]SCI43769.1 Ribose operon repressor [uncultured Clostridium sp.]
MWKQGVTAIFAANDLMAYGIYQYAYGAGIDIPDQLSVIGIDDTYINEILQVPLTSIAQPKEELGSKACEMLIYRVSHKTNGAEYKDILLPPKLVERRSVRRLEQHTVL